MTPRLLVSQPLPRRRRLPWNGSHSRRVWCAPTRAPIRRCCRLRLPQPAAPPDPSRFTLAWLNQCGGLHVAQKDISALDVEVSPADPPVKWQLEMARPDGGNLHSDVHDLLVAVRTSGAHKR